MQPETLPEFVTLAKAREIVGGNKPIHPSTLWRAIKDGRLPAPNRMKRINTAALLKALGLA
jgi:hypothetical protein